MVPKFIFKYKIKINKLHMDKQDIRYDNINIDNSQLVQINNDLYISNASANKIKAGKAKPVILAQQIDWSSATSQLYGEDITINSTDDLLGYTLSGINIANDKIVTAVNDLTTAYKSAIELTYNKLYTYVTGVSNNLNSSITQTADEIRTYVGNSYGNLYSAITQTAGSINLRIDEIVSEGIDDETIAYKISYLSMTKDEIKTYVGDTAAGLYSVYILLYHKKQVL